MFVSEKLNFDQFWPWEQSAERPHEWRPVTSRREQIAPLFFLSWTYHCIAKSFPWAAERPKPLKEMNHFQRLNEVKELKIFFFAQRANTQKQASNRKPLPCDARAPTVQNRTGAVCPNRTRQRCAQQTSSYITALPWPPGLIMGPLSKWRDIVLSSLPTHPTPFSPILGPRSLSCLSHFLVFSLHLYVLYVQSHHFPWLQPHALQSILFSRITAIRIHLIIWHMCPWRRLLPCYNTRFFLQRGCCCQGKEVVPVHHIGG